MALRDITKRKINRLEQIPDDFATRIDRVQKDIFTDILRQLDTLLLDSQGLIIANEANLAASSQIIDSLNQVLFEGEFVAAVTEFAREFNEQALVNMEYFGELFGESVTNKALYTNVIRQAQKNAVTLLSEDAIAIELLAPLRAQLEAGIVGDSTIPQLIESIRETVVGVDGVGALQQYTKTVARTTFAVGDANHIKVIADDLDIEFYKYDGALLKGSRDFCKLRKGKIFHKSEIIQWGSADFNGPGTTSKGNWDGRINTTNEGNIFSFRGGWNCIDLFLPMLTSMVPQVIKDRVGFQG